MIVAIHSVEMKWTAQDTLCDSFPASGNAALGKGSLVELRFLVADRCSWVFVFGAVADELQPFTVPRLAENQSSQSPDVRGTWESLTEDACRCEF